MSFNKKTISEVELSDKRVLLRADYNVPIKNGKVTDDYRIKQSLPTIQYLVGAGAKVIIISHLGRPEGKKNSEFSLKPAAERLSEILDQPVGFVDDCIDEKVSKKAQGLGNGQILVLENLRFYEGEEADNEEFARKILDATSPDLFVQDGFGVVHRAHASTSAIAKQNVMAVAGLLLEKEVNTLTNIMENPERPLTAVIGGAKIGDKIEILEKFLDIADCVAVVGAMANNFLVAEGHEIGSSLVDDDSIKTAKNILEKARSIELERRFKFIIPVDAVVSESMDGDKSTRLVDIATHSLSDISSYPKKPSKDSHEVARPELILDIGPVTAGVISGAISMSRSVIWNGTAGVTETKGLHGTEAPFSHGTQAIVKAMIGESRNQKNIPFSVVGGGDTVGYVEENKLTNEFNHVSTGGGASLELMSGKSLPGVEVLWNKD